MVTEAVRCVINCNIGFCLFYMGRGHLFYINILFRISFFLVFIKVIWIDLILINIIITIIIILKYVKMPLLIKCLTLSNCFPQVVQFLPLFQAQARQVVVLCQLVTVSGLSRLFVCIIYITFMRYSMFWDSISMSSSKHKRKQVVMPMMLIRLRMMIEETTIRIISRTSSSQSLK